MDRILLIQKIVKVMQEWYESTDSRDLDQTETLSDMVDDLQL
jgi:hypothetical protein